MARVTTAKSLRASVVLGGKIIEERLLPRHASVTIGPNADDTFVVAEPTLPESHKLFVWRRGRYELSLLNTMGAKIATKSAPSPVDFVALRSQGLLQQRGERYVMRLHDEHRGKVLVGDLAILFQFVTPPPRPPSPALPSGARSSLAKRVDWLLTACLAGVIALEAPVVAAVVMAPVETHETTLESMDDRWAQLILPERQAPALEAPEADRAQKPAAEAAKAKRPAGDDARDEAARSAQKAARAGEIRRTIASKGLLGILGAAGPGGSSGAVADVLGEGGLSGDLDAAFDGMKAVDVAAAGGGLPVGPRGPRAAGAAQATTIGGLATTGGGNVGLGAKQEGRVASVKTEAPEVDGKLDGEAVARVVRSRMRMVEDCYQRELKRNPQLQGRVELELTIDAEGAVQSVRVAANATGSAEVAECIVSRIQRWRFPKPSGGSVTVTFPFLFTSAG